MVRCPSSHSSMRGDSDLFMLISMTLTIQQMSIAILSLESLG